MSVLELSSSRRPWISTHQDPNTNISKTDSLRRPFSLKVLTTRNAKYMMAILQTMLPSSYPRANMTMSIHPGGDSIGLHVTLIGEQWNKVTSAHAIYHAIHRPRIPDRQCFSCKCLSSRPRQQRHTRDALAPTCAVSNIKVATYSSYY